MSPDEVIGHLIEVGLLDARDFVCGAIRARDRSARHRGVSVETTTRPGYFIKHSPQGDVVGTLDSEATFYRLVNGTGRLAALRSFVPAFHRYDVARKILVIGLSSGAETARGGERRAFSIAHIAESLAHALAACHSAGDDADTETRTAFSHMMPWAFHIAFPTPAIFRDVGPLQLDVIKLIQRQPDVLERFRWLRREWRWSTFTHGDIRWANVLVEDDDAVRLIDWETAGIGDPAWDLACAFEGWLSRALETLPLREGDGPRETSDAFAQILPSLQSETRELWMSYANLRGLPPDARNALLERTTAYVGARLVQSAYEWARGRPQLSPFILLSIQLGVNLLRQSHEHRARILGLSAA